MCSTVLGKWILIWAPQLTAFKTRSRTFCPQGFSLKFRSWPRSASSTLQLSLRGLVETQMASAPYTHICTHTQSLGISW